MYEMKFSEARASFADLFDQVQTHRATRITRRRDGPAILVSEEDFRALLKEYSFSPEVLLESGAVAIWLPELGIWGRGTDFAAAKDDLADEIDELLGLLEEDVRVRNAPNMVARRPWVYRLMLAHDAEERHNMMFDALVGTPAEAEQLRAVASV